MLSELAIAIESLLAAIRQIPPGVIVIVLLAGPTAAWIIYRSLVAPRRRRRYAGDADDLLWICENCRSANEIRQSHCYRCGYDREKTVGDLHVVDGDGLVALGSTGAVVASDAAAVAVDPGPGIPVGPGRTPDPERPAELPALAPRPEIKRPRVAVTSGVAPASELDPEPAEVVVDKTA